MSAARVLECDVCIFGAGAAGLYLAEVLSRDSAVRVVLLEAGPAHFADHRESYTVHSLRRQHKGANDARVTAFGGATNTWGGGLIRLARSDLQPLPGMSDTGWPLAYDELAHYYELVEEDFHLPREMAVEASAQFVTSSEIFRRRDMLVLPFRRKNFASTLGSVIRRRANVTALLNASLPDTAEVVGSALREVGLRTPEGSLRIASRHFVIAAGVVGSIALTKKLAGLAGREVGAVLGKFVQDHISIPLFSIQPKSSERFSRRFSYRFRSGLMFSERYETDNAIPGAYFHFTFDLASSRPLAAIKRVLESLQRGSGPAWGAAGSMLLGLGTMGRVAATRFLAHRLLVPSDVPITGVLDLEQVPRADWRIEPRQDVMGCDLSWDIGQTDIVNAARYTRAAKELVSCLSHEADFSAKQLFPDPEREPSAFEHYVRTSAWDTYHLSGGLRMGSDRKNSVVSPSLSLHVIRNVHVASTAVFPRAGAANPTLTLLALTRRLADTLCDAR